MPQIIRDISKIARCGVEYRSEKFAPMGLKACHGRYLTEICASPGISQEQLAKSISYNKSNVARQVAALEESGFIERRTCGKDKRVMRLYPTEKALSVLPQITQIMNYWQDWLIQDLSDEEQLLLESLLTRIKTRATACMEEQP